MPDGGASLLVGSKADMPPVSAGEDVMPTEGPVEGDEAQAQLEAFRDFRNAASDEEGLLALKDLIAMLK